MADPYIGEIRMFGGNFAPVGWLFCDGQTVAITEYEALFNLIGTTYGGDGQVTFQLPDLRGRLPVHQGTLQGVGVTFQLGERAGDEAITLTQQQIPNHTHAVAAQSSPGHVADPGGAFVAAHRDFPAFSASVPSIPMNAAAVGVTGGTQPHQNLPPYLCVNFIIAVFGIFPSQT